MSLEGDGFRLIADQMAMRMLFSRTSIRRAGVPMSTITIVPSYIESHGEKLPNYPISITLEGGALKEFHLESVLINERWGNLLDMRRKSIGTDWEISVEGLTFRAEWEKMKEWSDSYLEQLAAWRKTSREQTAHVQAQPAPAAIEAVGGWEEADAQPGSAAGSLMTTTGGKLRLTGYAKTLKIGAMRPWHTGDE